MRPVEEAGQDVQAASPLDLAHPVPRLDLLDRGEIRISVPRRRGQDRTSRATWPAL